MILAAFQRGQALALAALAAGVMIGCVAVESRPSASPPIARGLAANCMLDLSVSGERIARSTPWGYGVSVGGRYLLYFGGEEGPVTYRVALPESDAQEGDLSVLKGVRYSDAIWGDAADGVEAFRLNYTGDFSGIELARGASGLLDLGFVDEQGLTLSITGAATCSRR